MLLGSLQIWQSYNQLLLAYRRVVAAQHPRKYIAGTDPPASPRPASSPRWRWRPPGWCRWWRSMWMRSPWVAEWPLRSRRWPAGHPSCRLHPLWLSCKVVQRNSGQMRLTTGHWRRWWAGADVVARPPALTWGWPLLSQPPGHSGHWGGDTDS